MTSIKFVSRLDMINSHVDHQQGVIKGVSLVSVGEARGYNQFSDRTTLQQVLDCARKYSGGLRVKFNPNTFNHGDGSLAGRIPGDTLKIVGAKDEEQLVGDLHVYKNYASKEYLFEIAENAPDNCGLSIHFGGIPEEIDGKMFARCEEIFDATVVDLPAANRRGLFKAGNQTQDNVMTEEEIKKLGTAFAAAVEPIIEKSNEKVIAAFRQSNKGEDDGSPPTQEEMDAAGCAEDDSDEVKQQKVSAWRKQAADQPVTMKSLMQFFRFTGGRPARTSGGGEGVPGDDGKEEFEKKVLKYRQAGMTEGKAIRRAAQDDGKGYNAWRKKGSPTISFKQRGN